MFWSHNTNKEGGFSKDFTKFEKSFDFINFDKVSENLEQTCYQRARQNFRKEIRRDNLNSLINEMRQFHFQEDTGQTAFLNCLERLQKLSFEIKCNPNFKMDSPEAFEVTEELKKHLIDLTEFVPNLESIFSKTTSQKFQEMCDRMVEVVCSIANVYHKTEGKYGKYCTRVLLRMFELKSTPKEKYVSTVLQILADNYFSLEQHNKQGCNFFMKNMLLDNFKSEVDQKDSNEEQTI